MGLLYVEIHFQIRASWTQANPEVKVSTNNDLNSREWERRPAGPAASAEPSPQVSGRDLSSQTTRRNGGSTGDNGSVLFHLRSQSSLCWQHT